MQASVQNSTQQNQTNETQYSESGQASSRLLAQVSFNLFRYQVLVLVISTAVLGGFSAHSADHPIDASRACSVTGFHDANPRRVDAALYFRVETFQFRFVPLILPLLRP